MKPAALAAGSRNQNWKFQVEATVISPEEDGGLVKATHCAAASVETAGKRWVEPPTQR